MSVFELFKDSSHCQGAGITAQGQRVRTHVCYIHYSDLGKRGRERKTTVLSKFVTRYEEEISIIEWDEKEDKEEI